MTSTTNFDSVIVAGSVATVMAEMHASKNDLWKIDPACITVMEGFNVRANDAAYEAHIEKLTASIIEHGFLKTKPLSLIIVTNAEGEKVVAVSDGHSRLLAVERARTRGADVPFVYGVMAAPGTTKEALLVQLATGNNGKPLTTLETAEVCSRLKAAGWTTATIAQQLGVTVSYVGGLFKLMEAPAEVRDMITNDEVSVSVAVEMVREHGDNVVEELTKQLGVAKAKGEKRVTNKTMANPVEKFDKKNATSMANLLVSLTASDEFTSLPLSLQNEINNLMAQRALSAVPEVTETTETTDAVAAA